VRNAATLLCLLVAVASGWWHLVGLPGQRILAVASYGVDCCFAATESVMYRGGRYGFSDRVFSFGSDGDLRVCLRTGGKDLLFAWGRGCDSDGVWLGTGNWYMLVSMPYASALDAAWNWNGTFSLALAGSDTLNNSPLRSTDGGETWAPCDSGLSTRQVRCFAFNQDNPRFAVCGTRGHGLYLSSDSGRYWVSAGPDSLVDVVAAVWQWDMEIRALGTIGETTAVWMSSDTGQSWQRELVLPGGSGLAGDRASQFGGEGMWRRDTEWVPDGFPLTCRNVRCVSATGIAYFFAGTDSGVFHLDLTPAVTEGQPTHPQHLPLATTVRRVLTQPQLASDASAVLVDLSGRSVTGLHPGANDLSRLAPGVYFIREAKAQAVRKVVITK